MSKVLFEFTGEFWHWARGKCVLCQALSLFVYKPGTLPVSEEVAAAAEKKGAGRRIDVGDISAIDADLGEVVAGRIDQ